TGNTQTGGQTTENAGSTTPSTPENNSGTTQTPTQPDNNQNGSTGGNTGGGQTTPSNPGNNDGNQGGSTGGNGGTTTPEQPEKPQEPTIVSGYIGNSGKVFDTAVEANTWATNELLANDKYERYVLITIFYSDGSEKFSIDFR
ncbi:LysM peptidoglycan-binding domain-containing protein, partial [Enterococcus hirae]